MMRDGNRLFLIRFIAISLGVLLFLFGSYWLLTHGRITLDLPEGNKTISLTKDGVVEFYSTNENTFNRTVRSGRYRIVITNLDDKSSFIKSASVGRVLTRTKVTVNLVAESGRYFIGEGPKSCSEYSKNDLFTFSCQGSLSGLTYHVAGTDSSPTYTKQLQGFLERTAGDKDTPDVGIIEAFESSGDEIRFLTHKSEGYSGFHNIYYVKAGKNDFDFNFVKSVDGLPPLLSLRSIKNGNEWVLYDDSLQNVFAGDSFESLAPVELAYTTPLDEGLFSLDKSGSVYLAVTSESPERDNAINSSESVYKATVFNEKTSSKSLGEAYSSIEFCGDLICALNLNGEFKLFNQKLDQLDVMAGVEDVIVENSESVLLTSEYGVLRYNPTSQEGYYLITTPSYKNISASINSKGVLISMYSKDKEHALQLDNSTNYPDLAVRPLFDNLFINTASIYRDNIFISADLGTRIYDDKSGKYRYSQNNVDAASQSINTLLDELKLEELGFNVNIPILD